MSLSMKLRKLGIMKENEEDSSVPVYYSVVIGDNELVVDMKTANEVGICGKDLEYEKISDGCATIILGLLSETNKPQIQPITEKPYNEPTFKELEKPPRIMLDADGKVEKNKESKWDSENLCWT